MVKSRSSKNSEDTATVKHLRFIVKKVSRFLEPAEYALESLIFFWRWVLVPGYITLAVCLGILSLRTLGELGTLFKNFQNLNESILIAQMLSIVDMVLIANLVLMVIFVGYVNFVSTITFDDNETDRPEWMDELDYGGLKLQLLGSIVAISSVNLLKNFLELDHYGRVFPERLYWLIVLHAVFVFSILLFAVVNRLEHRPGGQHSD